MTTTAERRDIGCQNIKYNTTYYMTCEISLDCNVICVVTNGNNLNNSPSLQRQWSLFSQFHLDFIIGIRASIWYLARFKNMKHGRGIGDFSRELTWVLPQPISYQTCFMYPGYCFYKTTFHLHGIWHELMRYGMKFINRTHKYPLHEWGIMSYYELNFVVNKDSLLTLKYVN